MFSALLNAQNKVFTIPITAVTWSIPSNTTSTYTGSAQSVTVVSTTPPTPPATYSTVTTTATNAGQVASTTITGTGIYTGTFTSPTLTIIAATISGTAVNASATYNAASQSGTVITNVLPAGASYSGTLTASGTNDGTYGSSISGTLPNYTGTVNGGTFTINASQLTISAFNQFDCDGNENGYYTVSISGIQGGDTVSLVVYIGDINVGPQSVAPVLPFAIGFYNGVTSPGPNPRNITNADLVGGNYYNGGNGLVLKKNDGDTGGSGTTYYWIILNGDANYIS